MRMRVALVSIGVLFVVSLVAAQQQVVLSGTVTDGTGGVVPGVTITATADGIGATRTAQTGADGSYRLELPPGFYTVTATLPGFSIKTQSGVRVGVGAASLVNFTFGEGPLPVTPPTLAVLSGTVTADGAGPIVKATVEIVMHGGDKSEAETDIKGNYEKSALKPGDYSVTAKADGYKDEVKTTKLGEREKKDLDFTLTRK
jgi:hypothetical protein